MGGAFNGWKADRSTAAVGGPCGGRPSVDDLSHALSAAGYDYENENENESARLFYQLHVAGPWFALLGAEAPWTAKR